MGALSKDMLRGMRTLKVSRKAQKKGNDMRRRLVMLGIAALLLLAVVFAPTPSREKNSGITLYGDEPEAVLFGPVLPESMPEIMPAPVPDEVLLPDQEEEEELYVYASDDQECYHLSTCKFAYASGHRFTVSEALLLGYKPCGRCNPPTQ